MPAAPRSPFEYAVLRVVPRVERGERLNVGVILVCRPRRFLAARTHLDEGRLAALAPDLDAALIASYLSAVERIASGAPDGGPIARLALAERFHWLTAPASTILQPSAVHTGLCVDPAATLERLFAELVQPNE